MDFWTILWIFFSVTAEIVFVFLILEKLWPAILMVRTVLTPFFYPQEQFTLRSRFGTWAVITGCTEGIGRAYAFELASRNINVVLISRNPDKLLQTAAEIEAKHPVKTKIITADFGANNLELYRNISEKLEEIPVGILVNNVGANYTYPMYLHEAPEEELMKIMNINITATTMMTRIVLPMMNKNQKGAIVNVSSGSEIQAWPLMAVYASSKAFIKNFSDAIRLEYADKGITVQTLSPLFTNTKMNEFSSRLRETSLMIPDPATYARHAVSTLGKSNHTTGYWPHGVQYFLASLAPYYVRSYIAGYMNKIFRSDYMKQLDIKDS